MTVQNTSSTAPKPKPCAACGIQFDKSGGDVCITVEQSPEAEETKREAYNSAHRQCFLHMLERPPKSFKCITSGDVSSPRTELVLQRAVVEKLPLLLDISKSTASAGAKDNSKADLDIPCSVWGLVSLFLLLEEAVKQHHWFGLDCDASLPVQTLLAADFLGCKAVRKDIVQHLQRSVAELVDHGEKAVAPAAPDSTAAMLSQTMHRSYSLDWHNAQVLRYVPEAFTTEVFKVLDERRDPKSTGILAAMHLPQNLLARWVACTAPVLDLRSTAMSAMQLGRLLTVLQHDWNSVTELHIRAPVIGTNEKGSAGTSIKNNLSHEHNVQEGHCTYCRRTTCLQPTVIPAMSQRCSTCSHYKVTHHLTGADIDQALGQLVALPGDSMLHTQVLQMLAGVVPYMSSLQHLGLHHLPLQAHLMPSLGQVLLALPPSLASLTLDTSKDDAGSSHNTLQMRNMLFNAISLVKSLKELHMPEWEGIVGQDVECVQPLYRLPHLEVVWVREVKQTSAFPAGLPFNEKEFQLPSLF